MVRLEYDDGSKKCLPFRHDPDGWRNKAPVGKLPLLNLAAVATVETVWFVEGEKCVESASGIGLVATTSAFGAGKADMSDLTPLAGKMVPILPDNDEGGMKHADDVARRLTALDPPARVKIVKLPGLGDKEDIADWREKHVSLDGPQCRAELERLADETPEWVRPAEPADAAGGSEPDIERLEVVITPNESVVNDQAASALARIPGLYQRNGELVSVNIAEASKDGADSTPAAGTPTIRALAQPTIRSELTRAVDFVREKPQADGESVKYHSHPPVWCVTAVAARHAWPGVPHLASIAEMPFFRRNGSLVTRPGYDQETRILYIPSGDFPPVPENPTLDDAREATNVLFEVVQDVPFLPDHNAVWLATVLTLVARHLIEGLCPLFLFDASAPGIGKTLLAKLASIITTGRELPCTPYHKDPVETDKQLLAICMAGTRIVLFDNLEQGAPFGNDALNRVITSREYQGRILGISKLFDAPMDTVFLATGNNVIPTGDIARRIMPCRLVSKHERPETRPADDFAVSECKCGCKGDLLNHAKRKRPELAIAALTIIRAFIMAGMPQPQKMPPLGSFQAWSQLIRAAVIWATGIDPAIGRETLVDSDPTYQYHAEFVHGWYEVQESQKCKGMTTTDMLKVLAEPLNAEQFTKIRDAISGLWPRHKTGELPSTGSLGKKISAIRDTNYGGKQIVRLAEQQRAGVWSVQLTPK